MKMSAAVAKLQHWRQLSRQRLGKSGRDRIHLARCRMNALNLSWSPFPTPCDCIAFCGHVLILIMLSPKCQKPAFQTHVRIAEGGKEERQTMPKCGEFRGIQKSWCIILLTPLSCRQSRVSLELRFATIEGKRKASSDDSIQHSRSRRTCRPE